jgi:hypothetical protein
VIFGNSFLNYFYLFNINNFQLISKIQIPQISANFPINSITIHPEYESKPKVILAGRTGDLVVLSQEGGHIPEYSTSRTNSIGPIRQVEYSGDDLIWADDSGVRVLDTVTGEKKLFVDCGKKFRKFVKFENYILINFNLNKFKIMKDNFLIHEFELAIENRIVSFNLFDDGEFHVFTMSSKHELEVVIVDIRYGDIPVTESFGSCSLDTTPLVSLAGEEYILSTGSEIFKIRRKNQNELISELDEKNLLSVSFDFVKKNRKVLEENIFDFLHHLVDTGVRHISPSRLFQFLEFARN